MSRLELSTAELDRAEQHWWRDNGDLEEQYCWVQTPRVQEFLRGRYLRGVLRDLDPSQSVLELGCGTGWLTLQLARAGAAEVTGVDASPSQIERARAAADAAGLNGRVRLEVGDTSSLADDERSFDLVVMHAFLHHLTASEIREALNGAADLLRPGGRLALLEPTFFPEGPAAEPWMLTALRKLQAVPMAVHRWRLRRVDDAEHEIRSRIEKRWAGAPPFGPSPKELPFRHDELVRFLEERFVVLRRSPELSMAHLVTQEVLVARLSQPRLWGALLTPVLWAARALDRRLVRVDSPPCTIWIMESYECAVRDEAS